jgi:iron complex transport system permease protein
MTKHATRLLGLAALAAAMAGLCVGPLEIGLAELGAILARSLGLELGPQPDAVHATVLLHVRLPRVLFAAIAGAGTACAGLCLQAVFRNPLADPSLIGVTSGASLGAVVALYAGPTFALLHPALAQLALPLCAFVGALGATALAAALARQAGGLSSGSLLLAGLALNALCFALLGLALFVADDARLRNLSLWTLGSLGGANWAAFALTAPAVAFGLLLLARNTRSLDALLLGEDAAHLIGIDVRRLRRTVIAASALVVGAAVAFTGPISFLGLLAPHLARLALGARHRALLPACAALGACLLLLADLVARTLAPPGELPVGALLALLGTPAFLWLMRRQPRGALA